MPQPRQSREAKSSSPSGNQDRVQLTDSVQLQVEAPKDSDGPGAGGGYDEESVPDDDGPGAGGGYGDEVPDDGPGAGGGYFQAPLPAVLTSASTEEIVWMGPTIALMSHNDGPGVGGGYRPSDDGPGVGGGYGPLDDGPGVGGGYQPLLPYFSDNLAENSAKVTLESVSKQLKQEKE